MNWQESPKCRCGHRQYDHPYGGSCNPGNRMCSCPQFNANIEKDAS